MSIIPIVLFAYARPDHLQKTIACLRENQVPLIYAFSDGARTPEKQPAINEVRRLLRAVDWSELVLIERPQNLGLGLSIRTGVSEILQKHESVIVFEDDLICVPGTYKYLCAALNHYKDDERVMSITGWTHPSVIPKDITDQPYFDGRAECLVWGAWRRSWEGMDQSALEMIEVCQQRGIDVRRYGDDLVAMAQEELQRNIWAVRFLYLHLLKQSLCIRPPHSMVEHIGFDHLATNSPDGSQWENPPLQLVPPIPVHWPEPVEHEDCAALWKRAVNAPPLYKRALRKAWRITKHNLRKAGMLS